MHRYKIYVHMLKLTHHPVRVRLIIKSDMNYDSLLQSKSCTLVPIHMTFYHVFSKYVLSRPKVKQFSSKNMFCEISTQLSDSKTQKDQVDVIYFSYGQFEVFWGQNFSMEINRTPLNSFFLRYKKTIKWCSVNFHGN